MEHSESIAPGMRIEVEFPFYLGVHTKFHIDALVSDDVWIPGCKTVHCAPDDTELVAEGMGSMLLEVVDVHKPGKYPERVFYTRKWVDPDGNEFGSSKLHITTTPTFKRRAGGYYHEYKFEGESDD